MLLFVLLIMVEWIIITGYIFFSFRVKVVRHCFVNQYLYCQVNNVLYDIVVINTDFYPEIQNDHRNLYDVHGHLSLLVGVEK